MKEKDEPLPDSLHTTPDDETHESVRFFRGLSLAVALSLAFWAIIITAMRWLV